MFICGERAIVIPGIAHLGDGAFLWEFAVLVTRGAAAGSRDDFLPL